VEGFSNSIWSDIVIGAISLLIGIAVSYAFYRLQKRDVASAEEERLKHARAELMELVESLIINKQQVTEPNITNMVAAAERAHAMNFLKWYLPYPYCRT
jgi:archaellum component FlaF (FlaF/FlaG flagellin family)